MNKIKVTILLLIVLLTASLTIAANLNTDFGPIKFARTWNVSDSTASLKNIDTAYSPVLELGSDARVLFFSVETKADTDFASDSVYLMLQHSCDKINWVTYPTAFGGAGAALPLKSEDFDTVFQSALRLRLDSLLTAPVFIQDYIRIRAIYWDSSEADKPLLFGNTYDFSWDVYLRTIK